MVGYPRPRRAIDVQQQWLGFVGPWRDRLLARHGGWATLDGARSRFVPAPFFGAVAASMGSDFGWVASDLGLMFKQDGDRWTARSVPELAGERYVQIFGDREQVWLDHYKGIHELREGRWQLVEFGVRDVTATTLLGETLVLADGPNLYRRSGGRLEHFLSADDVPGEGRVFIDVCPSVEGGLLVVDDSGTVAHRTERGQVHVRLQGYVGGSWRHTHPDPDPDWVVDCAESATMLPSGRVAVSRRGRVQVFEPDGRKTPRGTSRTSPLLDEDPPLPEVTLQSLDAYGAQLLVGGHAVTVSLGDPESLTAGGGAVVDVGGERWRLDQGRLHIDERPAPTALENLAWCLPGDAENGPVLVDHGGQVHAFDGASFQVSEGLLRAPRHANRGGGFVHLATSREIERVPVDFAPATPLRDPEMLVARLAPARADIVVHTLPLAQSRAAKQLVHLTPLGTTAAGLWLTQLLRGTAESPGVEDHAQLAAEVMAAHAADTRYVALFEAERIVAWVAMQSAQSTVLLEHADQGRFRAALAG